MSLLKYFGQLRSRTKRNAFQRQRLAWGPPTVPPNVIASIDGSGMVLFCTSRGLMFRANRTGAQIWKGVTSGQNPDSLSLDLCREFGLEVQEASQHITDFIACATRRGLLLRAVK